MYYKMRDRILSDQSVIYLRSARPSRERRQCVKKRVHGMHHYSGLMAYATYHTGLQWDDNAHVQAAMKQTIADLNRRTHVSFHPDDDTMLDTLIALKKAITSKYVRAELDRRRDREERFNRREPRV